MLKSTIEKKWINPSEFEEIFGISQSTQAKKRAKKELPYSKLGGFVFYKTETIYELLEKHITI